MLFVPVTPPTPTSPRVRELSDRLGAEVDRYRQEHPGLSDGEVRLALRHLALRVGGRGTARLVGALVGGLAALAGVGAALFFSGSQEARTLWETLGLHGILGITVALLVVVFLAARGFRGPG